LSLRPRTDRKKRPYAGTACPRCRRPVPRGEISQGENTCPHCGGAYAAAVFDPPERKARVVGLADLGPLGGVSCAKHVRNAAVAACERCGAFMCELCRVEADGKSYCVACFERLSSEGSLQSTATRIKDYRLMAGTALAVGVVIWTMPVAGPVAIYYAVKGIKDKRRRGETEGRTWLGVLLALGVVECLAGAILVAALTVKAVRG
jgi:hypothetical protein